MGRWRHISSCLAILASLSFLMPAAALASGSGSSAGDQQYVDPFGGGTTTGSQPSTAPAPAQTPAPTATTNTTTSAVVASATTQTTQTTQTAAGDPPKTLPVTGLDISLTVGVGLGLLAAGLALRRTGRRA